MKSRKLIRKNRTTPSTLRAIRPCSAPTCSLRQDREVGLHQVRDQPDTHVPIDPGADVLDQVAPQDVHDLADQVGRAHDRQIESGGPKQRRLSQRLVALGIDRIDQPSRRKRDRRVGRTGHPHDQHRTPQAPGAATSAQVRQVCTPRIVMLLTSRKNPRTGRTIDWAMVLPSRAGKFEGEQRGRDRSSSGSGRVRNPHHRCGDTPKNGGGVHEEESWPEPSAILIDH